MALCNYNLAFQVPGDLPLEFLMAVASLHMFTNESGSGSPRMSALGICHEFATKSMSALTLMRRHS